MKLSKKESSKIKADVKKLKTNQKKELRKGMKIESEHTKNKEAQKKIALDHLKEDKGYYKKLKKIEKKK